MAAARNHSTVLTLVVLATAAIAAALVWFVFTNAHASSLAERFVGGGSSYTLAQADPQCAYEQHEASSPNRVVLYYADWCGHCKAFKPEFEKATARARAEGLDAAFLTVNSDKQAKGSACLTVKGVSGFPTVLLERDGTSPPFAAFSGARTADALLAWVRDAI